MSDAYVFRWDGPDGEYAGSVPSWEEIEPQARRLLRSPARAEAWAARQLRKPDLTPRRREALEGLLYLLLRRQPSAERLVRDDDLDPAEREPSLLARALSVSKRFKSLAPRQKAREHLLLDFEVVLRCSEGDPDRNGKLAILCELLPDYPAEDVQPGRGRSGRRNSHVAD